MAEYIELEKAKRFFENIDAGRVGCATLLTPTEFAEYLDEIEPADVAPVVHRGCEVCQGKSVITQDCDSGYSLEIDAEQSELAVWYGDQCLAVFSIDYCPSCGARMDDA